MSEIPVTIQKIKAREVLDSRGFPTVEAEMTATSTAVPGKTVTVRAIVPSGASTGTLEALELRDGDKNRYLGKGVLKAVENIHKQITPALEGREFIRQTLLDHLLLELDASENKSNLGANAILAVSMAFARAKAELEGRSLFVSLGHLHNSSAVTLPVPLMNIINGGKHADNGLAIQEFMIIPHGFNQFKEALRAGVEVFHQLKKILQSKGYATGVGDEGGFAPNLGQEGSHEKALLLILSAIDAAGYKAGEQISLGLDCAASEFCEKGTYNFEGKRLNASQLIKVYQNWCENYPIISIEDGLAEDDWAGWTELTTALGKKIQLVGDDLFVTNPKIFAKGIEKKVANSILIKLNQIGTVTETLETIRMASKAGYRAVISHRSGESEDSFIADLAVGTDAGQIKTGSASRSDRLSKYNQLLRIEEELDGKAKFARDIFKR